MLSIRKLVSADYDIFYAMRLRMLESSNKNYTAGLSDWQNASKEQIIAYLHEGETSSDNFVLGAFQENELVGMIGFRRETRASVKHKGSIWGLFEAPEVCHRGVEKALLTKVIKLVKNYDGFEYIRTMQNASNIDKMNLFLSLGFKQYGLEERSMQFAGEFFDHAYLKIDV